MLSPRRANLDTSCPRAERQRVAAVSLPCWYSMYRCPPADRPWLLPQTLPVVPSAPTTLGEHSCSETWWSVPPDHKHSAEP